MSKKVGVILSGCGVFDGSEIHEAVLTLLYISKAGAQVVCAAPDIDQMHVINHLTQEPLSEQRNVLLESARIARGDVIDIQKMTANDVDAVIIPGGFGAAKNLSNFATAGPQGVVNEHVKRLLNEMLKAGKPIGAICIAPATLTLALADVHPEVTIGNEAGTASAIETIGGVHHICQTNQICVDLPHKIVSTPAYMLGTDIAEVAVGIEKLVQKVIDLAG